MKIAEKFKDEMFEIAKSGGRVAVTKAGKITSCYDLPCRQCIGGSVDGPCNEVIREYLNKEYCECKFERDELVEVSDNGREWQIRHFAGMNDDRDFPYLTYDGGYTSEAGNYRTMYKYCQKYGTIGGLVKE